MSAAARYEPQSPGSVSILGYGPRECGPKNSRNATENVQQSSPPSVACGGRHGAPQHDSALVARAMRLRGPAQPIAYEPIVSRNRRDADSPGSSGHGACERSSTVHCVSNCAPTSDGRHGIGK